jgi:Na+-transporting NADH:ubiquinone oxidoreductase subunit NqrC
VSTLAIVLVVLGVLIILLFVGGLVANARYGRVQEQRLRAEIDAANEALADAHALDKGWELATMQAAAREAIVARNPGAQVAELHLVQVVDKPGTEEDLAVFRAITADGRHEAVTLGRREGAWVPAEAA